MYLEQRMKDVEAGIIVIGRYNPIITHLNHWLKFIDKDIKLKIIARMDCENYFGERRQTKKCNDIKISQSSIVNEQSSINAMVSWLFKKNETYIEAFYFKKLKPIDAGDLALKHSIFSKDELVRVNKVLRVYVHEPTDSKNDKNNATKAICGCFNSIAMLTGMYRDEILQLKWGDIGFKESEHEVVSKRGRVIDMPFFIIVRGSISKVWRTRQFMVGDDGFVYALLHLAAKRGILYYNFRHSFITHKINSGLDLMTVAEICGTSVAQIEKLITALNLQK